VSCPTTWSSVITGADSCGWLSCAECQRHLAAQDGVPVEHHLTAVRDLDAVEVRARHVLDRERVDARQVSVVLPGFEVAGADHGADRVPDCDRRAFSDVGVAVESDAVATCTADESQRPAQGRRADRDRRTRRAAWAGRWSSVTRPGSSTTTTVSCSTTPSHAATPPTHPSSRARMIRFGRYAVCAASSGGVGRRRSCRRPVSTHRPCSDAARRAVSAGSSDPIRRRHIVPYREVRVCVPTGRAGPVQAASRRYVASCRPEWNAIRHHRPHRSSRRGVATRPHMSAGAVDG
jgi:hypothetical protein